MADAHLEIGINRTGLIAPRHREQVSGYPIEVCQRECGAPGSPLVKAVSVRMTAPAATPKFLLRLMAKDLGYAIQEGGRLSEELKTAAAALEQFQRGIATGYGEKDIAAVVEPFRQS
jgi:3-hydroxyisobutyrate dehydrogenase